MPVYCFAFKALHVVLFTLLLALVKQQPSLTCRSASLVLSPSLVLFLPHCGSRNIRRGRYDPAFQSWSWHQNFILNHGSLCRHNAICFIRISASYPLTPRYFRAHTPVACLFGLMFHLSHIFLSNVYLYRNKYIAWPNASYHSIYIAYASLQYSSTDGPLKYTKLYSTQS